MGFLRSSFLFMYESKVSFCTSLSSHILTKLSRRLSVLYQKYCMMPSTRNTVPWSFMKRLRASFKALVLPVVSISCAASAAKRPPNMA